MAKKGGMVEVNPSSPEILQGNEMNPFRDLTWPTICTSDRKWTLSQSKILKFAIGHTLVGSPGVGGEIEVSNALAGGGEE